MMAASAVGDVGFVGGMVDVVVSLTLGGCIYRTKRGAYEGAIKETEGKMQALMKRAFASETIAE